MLRSSSAITSTVQQFSATDDHVPTTTTDTPPPPALLPGSHAADAASNLKRKASDDVPDQPRKLPRPGTLAPSHAANNLTRSTTALTIPKAPKAGSSTASSAARAAPARRVASASNAAAARRPATRAATATGTGAFKRLEDQVASIEAARAADSTRLAEEMEAERMKVAQLQAQMTASKQQDLTRLREVDTYREELDAMRKKHARELMDIELDLRKKEREAREAQEDLRVCRADLDREREASAQLKATVAHQSTADLAREAQTNALRAQLTALQATHAAALSQIAQLHLDVETAQKDRERMHQEVVDGETLRRKLHNTIQELKGNIRVFCRVRPALGADEEEAAIAYPDELDRKEIVLSSSSESAMGNERKEKWNFTFDKVFEPVSTQGEVFEEISHLAQSCVDGYNVCIFAYGQTGSGKSFTMEGGPTESSAGMIPRAVEQVFRVAEDLHSKGWEYKIEGQFLEIYNETINDLLGHGELDKKKHEIRHDKGGTRVTDVSVVPLRTAAQVRTLLRTAAARRTVAATLMNERSSRSHSVFTLRITGANAQSGEACEGCLNLVDLAGSERLNASGAGADKDRLRETQNINKSLSALGDVIAALGEKGASGHIPYRNSKLTYLLMNSLSGNSKTLMILNLSPLAAHLGESLCSLRFATKVNNTTLGTARKQIKSSSSTS